MKVRSKFRSKILSRFLMAGICFIAVFAAFFAMSKFAAAANPTTINFQGKVVNADGTNVTNGSYTFIFRIYSGVTASSYDPNSIGTCSGDTNCYWEETQTSIPVTNGVFQVELGSVCAFSSACNSGHSGIDFNSLSNLSLTMKFNGDANGYMKPLVHFNSVPYARNADTVGGVGASALAQLSTANTFTNTNLIKVASATALQVQNSSNKNVLTVDTSGGQLILGNSSSGGVTGLLTLDNTTNTNTVSIQSGVTSSTYTWTLPTADSSGCIQSNGAGVLSVSSCGGAVSFGSVTTGTSGVALHIGTSGSLDATGTGTITATALPINGLTAANADGSAIANSTHPLTWNWALASTNNTGLTLGETTAAASGGTILGLTTISTSTASPLTVTDGGTGNVIFNLASTGDLLFKDNGTAFLTLNDDSSLLYKPTTGNDTTSVFQIQPSGSTTPVFAVDTTNSRIGIGMVPASHSLDIAATISGDGIGLVGTTAGGGKSPGLTFLDATTVRGVLGLAEGNGNFSTSSLAGDIVLRADTGSLYLQTGVAAGGLKIGANNAVTFKNTTDSSTALQVQNVAGAPIFLVDTTSTDNAGAQVNYLKYGGFESGSFTDDTAGWIKIGGASAAIAQNNVRQHTYNGLYSLQVHTTNTAGDGFKTTAANSFVTTAGANVYYISLYAKMQFVTTMVGNTLTFRIYDGTANRDCNPSASVTINNSGFQRLSCFVTTSGNAVNLQVFQNVSSAATDFFVDSVQVETNDYNGGSNNITAPTAYRSGNIQLRGVVTSPLTLATNGDSTEALKITNTTGKDLLKVDTLNSRVNLSGFMNSQVAGTTGAAAGDIWYDSSANKMKINENGTTKTLCNTTDADCGNATSQTFTGTGSFTKSADAQVIIVEAIGGGGSGSGGALGAISSSRAGGAGGGGGAFASNSFLASDLAATVYASPGATKTGPASNTVGTAGNNTCLTSDSGFSCSTGTQYILAFAGGGGGLGTTAGSGGGGGGGLSAAGATGSTSTGGDGGGPGGGANGTPGVSVAGSGGGGGGKASTTAALSSGGASIYGGGGGGGSITTGSVTPSGMGGDSYYAGGGGGSGGGTPVTTCAAETGGAGGGRGNNSTTYTGHGGGGGAGTVTSGATGTAGTVGAAGNSTVSGQGGGGGGNSCNTGAQTGGKGGNGGAPGGGGGGGGAAANGSSNTGGAGGDGARGEVRIWSVRGVNADLAEIYGSKDATLQMADIVCLDPTMKAGVQKCQLANDSTLMGVYSTAPAMVIGGVEDNNIAKSVPVALAGRVPVKVSCQNGQINPGDYITSSNIPGVGMKATKAGTVIGQSMGAYDCTGLGFGVVLVFLHPGSYNGTSIESQLPTAASTQGVDMPSSILNYLLASSKNIDSSNSVSLSEITTDRLSSLQVISPQITGDQLAINSVSASTGTDISFNLANDGKIIIRGSDGHQAISFDTNGNANFSGTITADKIKANQIEGLQILTDKIGSLQDQLATGQTPTTTSTTDNTSPALTNSSNVNFDSLQAVNLVALAQIESKGGLTVDKDAQFNGKTLFQLLAEFNGPAIFHGIVSFDQQPVLNSDAGGVAIVKQGDQKVQIKFQNPYDQPPIVTASWATDSDNTDIQAQLFASGYNFLITKTDEKGFWIYLNKPADQDVKLNWIAQAVKDAKISQSQPATTSQ